MSVFESTFERHKKLALPDECNEIFVIKQKEQLKIDLIIFLTEQFNKKNISPEHMGLSSTEFKPVDWIEPMSDVLINNISKYFETIRGQAEKNLTPSKPIVRN